MKRSARVPLLILGTLTLMAGCSEKVDVRQNSYASRQDCMRDWGYDGRNCQPGGGGGGGGSHWLGPRYYWDHSAGHPYAVDPDGSTRPLTNSYMRSPSSASTLARSSTSSVASVSHGSISRGGFGSRSFRASSGG